MNTLTPRTPESEIAPTKSNRLRNTVAATLLAASAAMTPSIAQSTPTPSPSGSMSLSQSNEATNIVTILPLFTLYADDWSGGTGDFGILLPNSTEGIFTLGTLKPIPLDGSPVEQWATFSLDMGDGKMHEYYIDFLSRNQDFIDENLTMTLGSIGTGQSVIATNIAVYNTLGLGGTNVPVYTINSPIPEPGTLPLIGSGALALAGITARRSRKEDGSTKA